MSSFFEFRKKQKRKIIYVSGIYYEYQSGGIKNAPVVCRRGVEYRIEKCNLIECIVKALYKY